MLTKDDRQAKSILAALHNLTAALQERTVSAPQISNHEDYTPEILGLLGGVKDGLEDTKSLQRQSLRVQWMLFLATAAAFVAVGVYANIARLQKTTMDATLGQIQKQVAAAVEVGNSLARRSLQTAIEAERPWVGITFRVQDWTIGKKASAIAVFTNIGRRPAKVTRVQVETNEYASLPDSPRFRRNTNIRGSALILPTGSLTNTQPLGVVTQSELDNLGLRHHTFFIYASVDYEDVLTHSVHWTHGCWQYIPAVQDTASRFVKCSTYNDVDEEQNPNG